MAKFKQDELKYIELLASQYPTIDDASTEIINLQAILNLPKGTEHFITDIHGENEPFDHVLKNASGVIKGEIEQIWGNSLSDADKKRLATLIYYPEEKMDLILKKEKNPDDWYKVTLNRLIEVCRSVSSKYTRSKVRKAMPKNFAYILEELLNTDSQVLDKTEYYKEIVNTIVSVDRAREFIIAISNMIQRLAIDRLHVIGDIFDRGPGPDKIMETLMNYHSLDIQWGNHDILWMGAAMGSEACIANVVRICARYSNLDLIEDAYGINMLPLATFAIEYYGDDPCQHFKPKVSPELLNDKEMKLISQMHKAITIIQFKLEYQIIKRQPTYEMEDRLLLDKISRDRQTIEIDGKVYPLRDTLFPTIDPDDPYKLTPEEADLVEKLKASFLKSEKLQEHIRFMFSKGSLYLIFNSNLLYHGCIPFDKNGKMKEIALHGRTYKGKEYLDLIETMIRKGYYSERKSERQQSCDIMWYLWCGKNSPLFGKNKMATFESYFLSDKELKVEKKDPYYKFRDDEAVCREILSDFGLNPDISHIVNGHIPVQKKDGENPIKAGGKLISIDGGFAKAYQKVTGIAGYTLIFDSYGLMLVSYEPFKSTQAAIEEETDIHSSTEILEQAANRIMVKDTDNGRLIQQQIDDLKKLLSAYKKGIIKEQVKK